MTAHGNDSRFHRIEVRRNDGGGVDSVRFVCTAPLTAPCHQYANCGCEQWDPDLHGPIPAPGHEPVQQSECWMDPWFNETTDTWSDFTDLYDGPIDIDRPDVYGECADWLVSGPVDTTFQGDYMTWAYA